MGETQRPPPTNATNREAYIKKCNGRAGNACLVAL